MRTLLSMKSWALACLAVCVVSGSLRGEETTEEVKTKSYPLRGVTLELPEDWQPSEPTSRMRLAQFTLPKGDADEAPELVVFPPFGGSVDANISRWVKQFKPDGLESKITKGKSEQGDYYFVDLTGTFMAPKPGTGPFQRITIDKPDFRAVSVLLATEKGNYFLKLTGPKAAIKKQLKAYRASFGGDKETEKEYTLGG